MQPSDYSYPKHPLQQILSKSLFNLSYVSYVSYCFHLFQLSLIRHLTIISFKLFQGMVHISILHLSHFAPRRSKAWTLRSSPTPLRKLVLDGHVVLVVIVGWYTLPATTIAPENWWLEDDISFWYGPFSGDMLILRGVMIYESTKLSQKKNPR